MKIEKELKSSSTDREERKKLLADMLVNPELRREACRNDIALFSLYYFSHYHHYEMPDFHLKMYQDLLFRGEFVGAMWIAFRESAKTSLAKISLAHMICYERKKFILWVSYDQRKAASNLYDVAFALQTNQKIIDDFGQLFYEADMEVDEERQKFSKKKSVKEFITVNKIKVIAYSTGMNIRGEVYDSYRPDMVFMDDIETSKTVVSEAMTTEVTAFIDEMLSGTASHCNFLILANRISFNGSIIYLEDKVKTEVNWAVRDIPAMDEHGVIMWPQKYVRTDKEALEKNISIKNKVNKFISLESKERLLGYTTFNREMLNTPLTEEEREIKLAWLQKEFTEEMIVDRLRNRYVTIDVADSKARAKNDPDYTGTTIADIDGEGNWYLQLVKEARFNAPELIDWIFYIWETYKPIKIGVEKKSLEDQVMPYIRQRSEERQIFPVVVELKHGGTSKTDRIRGSLQGRLEHGKIFFKKGATDSTSNLKKQLYDFPKAKHDDLCLDGDTLIATPLGDREIRKIKEGDLVITPLGVKKVINSKCTGSREVIKKLGLIGTENHTIFSNGNFARLDTICCNDDINILSLKELIVWEYKKLLFLKEQSITSWEGKESIILVHRQQIMGGKILKDCMSLSGKMLIRRKFRKAITFIILMGTRLIITLVTWSAYRLANTCRRLIKIGLKNLKRNVINTLRKLGQWPLSGTNLKKERCGIKNTSIIQTHLRKIKNMFVGFAEKFSRVAGLKKLNFVQVSVLQLSGENQVSMTSKSRVSSAVKNLLKTNTQKLKHVAEDVGLEVGISIDVRKVYNLEVEDAHVYYANGILVGNCDALAYMTQIGQRPFSRGKDEYKSSMHREFYDYKRKQKNLTSIRQRILNL